MTELLAIIFGSYMMAAGLGLVLSPSRAKDILESFESNPALCYFGGAVIMMGGVALVMTHNLWSARWPEIMITLFGWGAAIEGALILIYPAALFGFARWLMPSDTIGRLFGIGAIALGAALIWL